MRRDGSAFNGTRLGRTICLVLGVLSLAASMESMFHDVRAPRDGVSDLCGGATSPDGELSGECSMAVQTHAQSASLRAIAGVGWMLGAVAFSLGDSRQPAAPPRYPATGRPTPPPTAAPGPPQWPSHDARWPHPAS